MSLINKTSLLSFLIAGWISFSMVAIVIAQPTYPPDIKCDQVVVYKSASESDLKLWVFNPPRHTVTDQAPAIVFFFGGGWRQGTPLQFVQHCEYLSARGMVSIVADYRVASRHSVLANDCVADAKSAVRWIREHAGKLGVDPGRIAAGGGSAGGHLAAATALLPGFDEENEDRNISSVPDALALFNPAVVLAPIGTESAERKENLNDLKERLGTHPEAISPYHHIRNALPPTIIFHGTDDATVPYESVEIFEKEMRKHGNTCTLIGYVEEGHGFFNYGKKSNGPFISTMSFMDRFLVELGWLEPPPEVVEY